MSTIEFSIEEHEQGIVLLYTFAPGWEDRHFIAIWDDVRAALDLYPERAVIAILQFADQETFANVRNLIPLMRDISSNDLNARIRYTFIVFPGQSAGRLVVDVAGKFAAKMFRLPFEVVQSLDQVRAKLPGKWAEIASSTDQPS